MAFNLFSSPALVVNKNNTQEALKQQMKPVALQPPKGEGGAEVSGNVAPAWTQYGSATTTPNRMYRGTIDPTSATSGMDAVNAMLTTPAEEERLRKASVANQRIMAIGDALRHIGNIYHTVRYAPSQKFSSPVQDEVARYERGKALRDAANLRYYTYQQQKAAQDARMQLQNENLDLKMRQLGFQQEKFNRQHELNRFKADLDKWYKEATVEQKERALDIQRQLAEGRLTLMEAQTELAKVKTAQGGFAPRRSGGGGGSGYKYWFYDENGNLVYVPNETKYNEGVTAAANNAGIPTSVTTREYDVLGEVKKENTKPRKPTEVGADLANRAKGMKKGNASQTKKKLTPNRLGL